MNKIIARIVAVCLFIIVHSSELNAQLQREPQTTANVEKSLIKIDDNYTGYFKGLVGKDVEVIGVILFDGEAGKDKELREWANTSRGGFILTNWGRIWSNKKVRIIGKVTKGFDEQEEFEKNLKPGQGLPAYAFRIEYLLTIKSIELLDSPDKDTQPVPQATQPVPQIVPQR